MWEQAGAPRLRVQGVSRGSGDGCWCLGGGYVGGANAVAYISQPVRPLEGAGGYLDPCLRFPDLRIGAYTAPSFIQVLSL